MSQPAGHLRNSTATATASSAAPSVRPGRRGPAPEPARHLRVVGPSAPSAAWRRRRARALLAGGIVSVVAIMFALVYLHVVLTQRQIQLDEMSSQLASDTSQYQGLRLQVAELESPQNIISVAEGHLGMRPPASVTYVSPPASPTPPVPQGGTGATIPTTLKPGGATVSAPAGDADWPSVKAALAGRP